MSLLVAAAQIRDHETGLVSGPFSWFQSRQIFHETHETEANPIYPYFTHFQNHVSSLGLHIQGRVHIFEIMRHFLIVGD